MASSIATICAERIVSMRPIRCGDCDARSLLSFRPLFLHQLLFCSIGEVLEFELYARRGDGRVLGAEIGGDLGDNSLVAARVELGVDNVFAVGVGGLAEEPELLRRPEAQHHVPARVDLEPELLIVHETGLELLFAIRENLHRPLVSSSLQAVAASPVDMARRRRASKAKTLTARCARW